MDPKFTFPRPQAPVPRPRPLNPSTPPSSDGNRESNALRASVLDAALQLGIGSNSLVSAWMFNNPVPEEDEEDQVSPSLTYGSSATSDESFRPYPPTPSTSTQASHHQTTYPLSRGLDTSNSVNIAPSKPSEPENIDFATSVVPVKLPDGGNNVSFPSIPIPPRPTTPGDSRRKLKKKRGDGYESDGGYISEGGKKKEKKDKKKKDKGDEELGNDTEPGVGRKKKKSFVTLRSKKSEDKVVDYETGYETDGVVAFGKGDKSKGKKKGKKASADAGYESDAGYRSASTAVKKSKSRFFKIGSKSSKPDLRQDVERPDSLSSAEKEKDSMSLPIAERFATTLAQPLPTIPQSPTPLPSGSTSSILPDRRPIPQDLVLPPISLDSLSIQPPSNTPSPKEHVAARDSHISAISATSTSTSTSSSGSHHKRKFFHFPGIRETGHGQGGGSNSTITSGARVRSPSPPSHSPISPSAKFPAISFPVTRATSPAPGLPASTLPTSNSPQDLKRTPDALSPYRFPPRSGPPSRAPSPAPPSAGLTPGSPYVMVTPIGPLAGLPTSPRPRNPPTDGFGPRPRVALGGPSATTPPSPQKPSHLTIPPPSDSLPASPRNSALQSPNVLAYYDLPPPSPPPALPLPRVPQDPGASVGLAPHPRLPSRVTQESTLAPLPVSSIQRGKESPFPVSPRPMSRATSPMAVGLPARPAPRRYEDFNDVEGLAYDDDEPSPRAPGIDVVEPSEDGGSFWEEEDDDMNDVLQRFEDTSSEGHDGGRALDSRRSFEAIKINHVSLGEVSQFDDDDDGQTVRRSSTETNSEDRNHRWSGSIYSRASFLDPDKSEETRQRFLKRVESMLNEEGRNGGGSAIPPVPKLPEGLAGAKVAPLGRSWNRF